MTESKRSRSGYGATTSSQELRSLVSNHQSESLSDSDEDYSPTIKLNDTSTTLIAKALIGTVKAVESFIDRYFAPTRLPEINLEDDNSTTSSVDHYDEPKLYGHGHKKYALAPSKKAIAPSNSTSEEKKDINSIPKSTLVKLVTGNSESTLRELLTEENNHKKEGGQRDFYRGRIW